METPGGIMVIDGVRYRRSSPTNITKLCCYERAGQQCDQAALSSQPLCGYHFSGRSMIQKDAYFSVGLKRFVSPNEHSVAKGDIRCQGEDDVQTYDGKQWRRCCAVCWKLGRPHYCSNHDPAVPSVPRSFSRLACRFMDQLATELSTPITHKHIRHEDGLTDGNEFQIPGTAYMVDGYIPESKTVIEFLGDYWHGNPAKHRADHMNTVCGKTFGFLHEKTFQRMREIANLGFRVYYIWERTYNRYLEEPASTTLMSLMLPWNVAEKADSHGPAPKRPRTITSQQPALRLFRLRQEPQAPAESQILRLTAAASKCSSSSSSSSSPCRNGGIESPPTE